METSIRLVLSADKTSTRITHSFKESCEVVDEHWSLCTPGMTLNSFVRTAQICE